MLVLGSVIVNTPPAVDPGLITNVAEFALLITCELIDAPLPPVIVNIGVPGVPGVHAVEVPVNVTERAIVRVAVMLAVELDAVTVMFAVALELGSVIEIVPAAEPEFNVNDAEVLLDMLCDVIAAPFPPVRLKIGAPGVPADHVVLIPVIVIIFPLEFVTSEVGLTEIVLTPADSLKAIMLVTKVDAPPV